jgi:hypothetical protein
MMYGLFIGTSIVGVALLILVMVIAKGSPVAFLVQGLAGLAFVIGFLYVSSWSTLAMTTIIVNSTKIGVIEAFKKVKPLVPQFIGIHILTMLFFLGLFPVSIVLIFVPMVLWAIWGGFMVFVFLDKKKSGLSNLWVSKAMVSQNFWGIVGRFMLLYVAIFFFSFLVMSSRSGVIFFIWQIINMLIIGPFLMSYIYEMYTQLDKPNDAPRPTIWIVVSVIGFVLMILGMGAIVKTASEKLPAIIQQQQNQQINNQFQKQFEERMKDPAYNNKNMRPANIKYNL